MTEYDDLFDTDLDSNINFDLCHENDAEEFDGLDKHAAQTWIYPTNLPLRQYQFDIVKTALFHNTMVSLPTGLGKTMIAAVVMYNMYRWYPSGRIIFMAPTRPLVAQQADACRKITCIPKDHTIQLTGDTQNTTRGPLWEKTRVFFITPQILQKDLQSKICPAHLIRCIVIDEAHRARGNYAYCEVLRLLGDHTSKIRILALSATPGATPTQVAEVCRALKISRLEVRTESSEDVKPYVFNKITETVVVPLGEPLASIRDKYIEILDHYTRRLMKSGVLTGSAGNIHKGRIFMIQKEYKENCQRMGKRPDNYILQDLTFCLTLYHAFEVLIKHGLRGFVAFYNEHGGDKSWVRKDERLTNLLSEIQAYLGSSELNVCQLPDGSVPEIDSNLVFGHPKFNKLRDICQQHFIKYPDTRVMIFCEYRDSVQEAFAALLTCRPLIRPRMFLGQSAISQKQQLFVMEKFRKGECNTLICTCVAEEGLDVAAVQLIICFDIANRSPIRLAQRMGRTGRHQIGRVVILVTEGREQQTLAETMQQSSLLDEKLTKSMIVNSSLLPFGPPVIPSSIQPECLQLHMESTDQKTDKKQTSPKQGNRRNSKKADENEVLNFNQKLPEDNFIPTIGQCLWTFSKDDLFNFKISKPNKFFSMIAPTNFLKQVKCKMLFGPSKDTEILTELYRKSEDLKYNLPVKNIKSTVVPKTKNRDIREMFGKSVQSQQDKNDFITQPKIVQQPTQEQESQKISNTLAKNNAMYLSLLSEFSTNKTIELLLEKTCDVCEKLFNCEKLTEYLKLEDKEEIQSFTVPDESILNSLTHENLKNYDLILSSTEYFNFEQYNREKQFEKLRQKHDPNFSIYDFHNPLTQGLLPQRDENSLTLNENTSKICDISFKSDFDSFIKNEFKTPKTTMQNCSMSKCTEKSLNSILGDDFNTSKLEMDKSLNNSSKFKEDFNISELCNEKGDEKIIYELTDDSLERTTFEEYTCNSKSKISNVSVYQPDEISKKALQFFGLNSIESLFDDEVRLEQNLPPKFDTSKQKTITNKRMDNDDEKVKNYPVSPVLNTQKRFSSQTMTQSSFFPRKSNDFVLWDESLFIDDSMVEKNPETEQLSPVLNTQPSLKCNLQSKQKSSPNLSSQTKVHLQKTSPILNSQHFRKSDSQIPASNLSPMLSSQRSKSVNTPSISKINIDYLSDEDIFADESVEDDLFYTAQTTVDQKSSFPKQVSPTNLYTANENMNKISIENVNKNTLKNANTNSSSQKENIVNNKSPVSNKFRNNKLNMFQLKRNLSEVNSNTVNNAPKINFSTKASTSCPYESDSDDASLLDFITRPSRKKLKLGLKKGDTSLNSYTISDESIENKSTDLTKLLSEKSIVISDDSTENKSLDSPKVESNKPIAISDESIENADENCDKSADLSIFSFVNKKKVLGQKECGNNSLMSYEQYKRNGEQFRKTKKKKKRSEFIDYEAEVSDDEEDSDEEDGDDDLESSFVVDNNTLTQTNVDMHALYLQSVKNNSQNGKFKIPNLPPVKMSEICSQADWNQTESNYVIDSFCVDNTIVMNEELSLLEIAEMELEKRRRRKRKNNSTKKLSRIKNLSDDSSDEEDLKRLRLECLNNQSVLR